MSGCTVTVDAACQTHYHATCVCGWTSDPLPDGEAVREAVRGHVGVVEVHAWSRPAAAVTG